MDLKPRWRWLAMWSALLMGLPCAMGVLVLIDRCLGQPESLKWLRLPVPNTSPFAAFLIAEVIFFGAAIFFALVTYLNVLMCRVRFQEDGVSQRRLFRTIHIPWKAIDRVQVQMRGVVVFVVQGAGATVRVSPRHFHNPEEDIRTYLRDHVPEHAMPRQ